MAEDKEPFEALTAAAAQTAEQITKQTQDYFGWLQKAMSALPWSNTNLNRIPVSHATQNVTATTVTSKTNSGFNVVLTPVSTVTLSAGTFDVLVIA